jgi:hypothetical protein
MGKCKVMGFVLLRPIDDLSATIFYFTDGYYTINERKVKGKGERGKK